MKIAVLGTDFPLGKRALPDERLQKLKEIVRSLEITHIQIEFVDSGQVKTCDGILCEEAGKLDLILSDLEVTEAKLASEPDNPVFLRAKETLEKEVFLNEVPFAENEKKLLSGFNLATLKPLTFVNKENLPSIPEMMQLVFANCGMLSFFTANEKELRAWPIKKGTTVYEAAGTIHSDIQRGFIKAEVAGYEDLIKSGSLNAARSHGLIKLEDKNYIVRGGDLIQIRFSV